MNIEPMLLRPAQVAALLNVGTDKVLELLRSGRLEGVTFGPRTIRIHRASVERLLKNEL